MIKRLLLLGSLLFASAVLPTAVHADFPTEVFAACRQNGELANEGFRRCDRFVRAWLAIADPTTGLIPRNNRQDQYWNAKDSAADNYPFMVLTTHFTDPALLKGRMKEMLDTEIRLTSRIDNLPDTFVFATQGFQSSEPNLDRILFGASEYVKDGLLPLTEWLGPSPWSDRMIAILDDIWKHAPMDTKHGRIPSKNPELNGEMLQVLSRVYWMTGDDKYLDWAIRLGDYYLLDEHHPTRDSHRLRLRDHGCEVVSGLCELYATVHFALPSKKSEYKAPLYELLDRILEIGANEHGMFYNSVDPISGEVDATKAGLADTWGYTYNGFYTVYLVDGTERYRDSVVHVLSNLNANYRNHQWEGDGADGYADSIESALNLYNREPVESARAWIDSEIQVLWQKQQPSGIVEGWHGDGNFARTTLMYCLWKTQGVSVQPWRDDVMVGAVRHGDSLYLSLSAKEDWAGRLVFDTPRHATIMHLPIDWPRINQFPEWFTVEADRRYEILVNGEKKTLSGQELRDGIDMVIEAGTTTEIVVTAVPSQ